MKVIIWIEEDQLEELIKGNVVDYWEREPGIFEKVIQVTVNTDTYQKLKDARQKEKEKLPQQFQL